MLIVQRYTDPNTKHVTVQVHLFRNNNLIKSYNPCDVSLLNVISDSHKKHKVFFTDVGRMHQLGLKDF